ncbi:MAG: PEP-CTERM sorting domain-containing protein [Chthonomonas sp.]|nr:PEP-CTERM sorting domain-containing protein [Chthonomonas sp.]
MKLNKLVIVAAVSALSSLAHAQFSGLPYFSVAPTTQVPGPLVSTLTVAPTPTGLVVSGTVTITAPPGTYSGTLLRFTAVRPLQVAAWIPPMTTTITQPGTDYINNPVGNGLAFGQIYSSVDTAPASNISTGLWANSGPGFNYYNGGLGYSITSAPFSYAGGAGNFLKLTYDLDFNYSGPGGTYFFTLPTYASINTVPEPTTMLAIGSGVVLLARRRRRARS